MKKTATTAKATKAQTTTRPAQAAPITFARFSDFLTYRLSFLTKRIDTKTARLYLEQLGLNLAEARAVSIIASLEPLSVQQLAGYGSLDKSQASRVAVSLLEKGLISKSGSADDARAVSLSLTKSGRETYEAIMHIARMRNGELLAPLNPKEQRTLLALLDKLMVSVQANDD